MCIRDRSAAASLDEIGDAAAAAAARRGDDTAGAGGGTGHVTSLAVLHSYRRNGVALGLMDALHNQMSLCHGAGRAQLHVRCSNEAALRLYASTLRYKVAERISRYYHDDEDAFLMALDLDQLVEPIAPGIDDMVPRGADVLPRGAAA